MGVIFSFDSMFNLPCPMLELILNINCSGNHQVSVFLHRCLISSKTALLLIYLIGFLSDAYRRTGSSKRGGAGPKHMWSAGGEGGRERDGAGAKHLLSAGARGR